MNNQYDLRGGQKHPDVLSTLADYQNAPDGTVVIHQSMLPSQFVKRNDWWYWEKHEENSVGNVSIALRGSADVIHWGEGKYHQINKRDLFLLTPVNMVRMVKLGK